MAHTCHACPCPAHHMYAQHAHGIPMACIWLTYSCITPAASHELYTSSPARRLQLALHAHGNAHGTHNAYMHMACTSHACTWHAHRMLTACTWLTKNACNLAHELACASPTACTASTQRAHSVCIMQTAYTACAARHAHEQCT